jgi:hypothetical protein
MFDRAAAEPVDSTRPCCERTTVLSPVEKRISCAFVVVRRAANARTEAPEPVAARESDMLCSSSAARDDGLLAEQENEMTCKPQKRCRQIGLPTRMFKASKLAALMFLLGLLVVTTTGCIHHADSWNAGVEAGTTDT